MIDIRLPNITGSTEREQLVQVKSYLHQLAEQLQWALQNVDTSNNASVVMPTARSLAPSSGNASGEINAQATFASIKSLIIKSAEIVDAYYDEINARLEGLYVAQSDFGTFVKETEAKFVATSKDITQTYTNIQTLESTIGGINTTVETLGETVQTIDGTVQTLGGTVQTLDGTVQGLGSTIQNVDGKVTSVESKVTGVESKVTGVESKVTEVEGKVSTVETEVGTVKDKVSTVEGEVSTVKEDVKTVGDQVVAVDGKVDTVAEKASTNLQEAKEGILGNVDALSGVVNGHSKAIQDVKDGTEKSIKDVGDRVDGLSGEIDGVKSDVDEKTKALEEAIKTTNVVVATVTGTIKTGELDEDEMGLPVYGLEIGQRNTVNGVETFNKYARFTASRLSFYDKYGEVAWISNNQLHITEAEVTGNLKIGGYLIDTSNGLAFKWVGR
jgi:peptidoglycan hydrolase CwlO-like protein